MHAPLLLAAELLRLIREVVTDIAALLKSGI